MYATNLRMYNSGSYQRTLVKLVTIEELRLSLLYHKVICYAIGTQKRVRMVYKNVFPSARKY
jgi:hypothetical protein